MDITLEQALADQRNSAAPKFVAPPTFDPRTDNGATFIKKYEKAAAANNWNDGMRMKYLGLYLEVPADSWYERYIDDDANKRKTWKQIRTVFVEKFCGNHPTRMFQYKFNKRIQMESEDLRTYYYDLLALAEEADPDMTFKRFFEQFDVGMHESYRETFDLRAPANLDYDNLEKLVITLSDTKEKVRVQKMVQQTALLALSTPRVRFEASGNGGHHESDDEELTDTEYDSDASRHSHRGQRDDFNRRNPEYRNRRFDDRDFRRGRGNLYQ